MLAMNSAIVTRRYEKIMEVPLKQKQALASKWKRYDGLIFFCVGKFLVYFFV
jgi:hypothetical protein